MIIESIIILFSSTGKIKKTSSIDGPEIWICKIETTNIEEETKAKDISECLSLKERKNFTPQNLEIGGKKYKYNWKNDVKRGKKTEEWTGQFIGYPLTDVKDRTFIKENIIEKLDI